MPPDSPPEVAYSEEDDPMTSDDGSDDEATGISDYEKAVQKRREENRNLLKSLGIYKVCLKQNFDGTSSIKILAFS